MEVNSPEDLYYNWSHLFQIGGKIIIPNGKCFNIYNVSHFGKTVILDMECKTIEEVKANLTID